MSDRETLDQRDARWARIDREHKRRARLSPCEIEIKLNHYKNEYEEGVELQIEAALWPSEETPYTCAEVTAGFVWVAGVIARLGLALGSRMRQPWCHGLGRELTPVRRPEVYGNDDSMIGLDGPSVTIQVPRGEAKRWLAIAKTMLGELLAADASECHCAGCMHLADDDRPAVTAASSAKGTGLRPATATPALPATERNRP